MTVGNPPLAGMEEGLVDANWLRGLAAQQNSTFQSGITASGSTQAGAFQLPSGVALFEIDTATSAQGVALPPAIAGTEITIYNNTAQTNLVVYPSIVNNFLTGAQDTINNTTSLAFSAARQVMSIVCAKTGVWAAGRGS